MAGIEPLNLAGPNPYVGPRPIETGEPIFGRQTEVEDLYYRLLAERIILLYSPSGAGKSSLIKAGLIPKMRETFDAWRPTRVGTQKPASLGESVNSYVVSAMLGFEEGVPVALRRPVEEYGHQSLSEYVRSRPRRPNAPSNLFLVFDQFEELLTVDAMAIAAKNAFFDQLGELLHSPNIWALIAMREDFLAAFDPYAHKVPTHLKHRFRIDRLTVDAAIEAVTGPAALRNRSFVPEAAASLVQNLAKIKVQKQDGSFLEDQPGLYVEPMQLQVVCHDLWKNMPANDLVVSPEDIEKFGNVTNALSNYYEHQINDISGGDTAIESRIRRWIGNKLITSAGIRGQVLMEASQTAGLENHFIEALVSHHLVRAEHRSGAMWFELAHDRLIEPIRDDNREWLDKHLVKVQKTAALWIEQDRVDGLLLLGEDLLEAQRWANANPASVSRVERDFLWACESKQEALDDDAKEARREQRRAFWAKVASVVFGVVALAAIASMVYAFNQQAEAIRSKQNQIDSMKELYREKARIAVQGVASRGAATDYQQAWIYHLALLYFSDKPEPEVAGRLLQNHLLPDYNEGTSSKARNLLKSDKLIFKAAYAPGTTHLIYALSPVDGGYSDMECSNPTPAGCQKEAFRNVRALAMHPDGKQFGVRYRDKGKVEWVGIGKPLTSRLSREMDREFAPGDGAIAMGLDLTAVGSPLGDVVVLKQSQREFSVMADIAHLPLQSGISALAWQQGRDSMLASAWKDSSLHIYQYADQKLIKYKEILKYKHISDVNALAFWPGSSLLVSGHGDGYIRVWDYEAGELVAALRLHDESILALTLDPTGETLTSVSRDGIERTTMLKPRFFGRDWELKSLLAVSGKKLREELYIISKKMLGYSEAEEPRATKNASALALEHFDLTKLRLFNGLNEPGIIKGSHRPANLRLVYPELSDDGLITLMPDQVQAARSEVSLTQEIPQAFKIEFEYLISTDKERAPWTRGNFLALEFFKDIPKPDMDMPRSQDIARSKAGYSLQFDVYPRENVKDPKEHIVLLDLKQKSPARPLEEKAYEPNQIFTGQNWRKACIEVRAKPGKALCKPEETEFQGVHVYLNGEQRFNYPKELIANHGGLGFAAFSGLAMSNRQVRRVFVTPANEITPGQRIPFGKDNTVAWHYESAARRAGDKIEGFPKIEKGILLLTPPDPHWRANSMLVAPTDVPEDFSVEFEYSIHNNQSSDPQRTGQGIVFLFGKDAGRYAKEPSPDEDVNAFQADSGCGIHFEVFQIRSIQLKGNCLKGRTPAIKANLIQGLPDVYTEGRDGENEWRAVRVEIKHSSGRIRLFFEKVEVLDEVVTLDDRNKAIGFGSPVPTQFKFEAAAEHKVRNVVVRPLALKAQ